MSQNTSAVILLTGCVLLSVMDGLLGIPLAWAEGPNRPIGDWSTYAQQQLGNGAGMPGTHEAEVAAVEHASLTVEEKSVVADAIGPLVPIVKMRQQGHQDRFDIFNLKDVNYPGYDDAKLFWNDEEGRFKMDIELATNNQDGTPSKKMTP